MIILQYFLSISRTIPYFRKYAKKHVFFYIKKIIRISGFLNRICNSLSDKRIIINFCKQITVYRFALTGRNFFHIFNIYWGYITD